MKTIVYEFPVKEIIRCNEDFDGFETESYEYDVEQDVVEDTLVEIFADFYGLKKDVAKKIVFDYDLLDMIEAEFEDDLEEWLEEICYKKAYKEWEEYRGC